MSGVSGVRLALVVDGANVVGSRPDGWWRDRPGAAARLHARLVRSETGFDEVVLVLEGKARPGVPEGAEGGVRTVHAPGVGDDLVVEQVVRELDRGCEVTVVTADRGLVERVTSLGAATLGPTWLLDHP